MIGRDLFESNREHRECWELLPWFANQRLTEAQTQRIERHLQQCEACRVELQEQHRLRDAIRAEDPLVIAPQTGFNKLMQRIDSEEDAQEFQPEIEPQSTTVRRSPRMPRWLAIAASVQVVTVAALLGSLWWQQHDIQTAPRFTTLTSPGAPANGPVLRVVFDEQTKLVDVSELLKTIDAHVIAGPTDAGVFTLALDSGKSQEALNSAVARLRQDRRVVFCEPALMESEHQ
jgi:hypothetical protein